VGTLERVARLCFFHRLNQSRIAPRYTYFLPFYPDFLNQHAQISLAELRLTVEQDDPGITARGRSRVIGANRRSARNDPKDQRNAERLYALYNRANELVGELEVDLNAPLPEDDE